MQHDHARNFLLELLYNFRSLLLLLPATIVLRIFRAALLNCTQKAVVRNAKHYKFTSREKIKEKFISQFINIVVQNLLMYWSKY